MNNQNEMENQEVSSIEAVECTMSNTEICQCLKVGSFSISCFDKKRKNRSTVWESFGQILMSSTTVIKEKVACRTCLTVLNYRYQWGTSNLVAHKKGCEKRRQSTEGNVSQEVKTDIKKNVKSAVVQFVCQDLRAFNAVAGDGFRNLADQMINLGCQFGEAVTAREVLPHPNTVSNAFSQTAVEHRLLLKQKIMDQQTHGISVSLDIWTEPSKSKSFINLNAHFIDEKGLQERTLCVKSLEELEKSGVNILVEISNILTEFGVEDLQNVTFVTDRGSNIKSALKDYDRLDCAAHIINNIVLKMMKDSSDLHLQLTLKEARSVVKYVKKSEIQSMLETTLKAESPTRWNGEKIFVIFQYQDQDCI